MHRAGKQRQARQGNGRQYGRVAGLVKQATYRVTIIVRGKQAREPGNLIIARVAVDGMLIGVNMRRRCVVQRRVHHLVHQTLGAGQQQGTGQRQHPAGPYALRQSLSGQHRRWPLPYLTLTASVTR